MPKIDVESVDFALHQAKIQPEEKIAEVLKIVQDELEAQKLEKEKKVRQKSKTLLLASVKAEGQDVAETPIWIFKTPEDFDHTKLEYTINQVILDFKATGKKKAGKISTIGDGILYAPAKFFKARNITRVTKEPVLVQKTDNVIKSMSAVPNIPSDEDKESRDFINSLPTETSDFKVLED